MKQFIEFIPLIVFFAVYKFYDIYMATGALVVVTGLQLLYSWVRYRKVEKMQLFTFILVGFFGGLTVFFHDDTFIKWKVTIINVLFALGLLISRYGFGKNLIKQMLAKELQAPDAVWDKVNLGWVGFFTVCGLLNLYVAFSLPQEMWVNFKVFGLLGMTLVFTLLSGVYLYRHIPAEQKNELKK
ncbi:MAG: septation protein A [Aeromonas sobria]|uniref:Inner membrane-spanning protein YciB n=1 Tax=Aeromonas sobria TaxID=646 RepID=A0A2N3IRQ2_AERSO|nr:MULTISPECIES: septation protein A [Aeromonas]ATL91497.1 septation protein A [Aeromonas sp. CU5]EKP0259949.1 septation protein A [Aeromonas sobria]ELM3614434.1 septation protein A [Aeromonas sobria]PKQ73677.1 intracellular septation protein A [Aeromonas sobria]PKQ74377.1 septation protein A [Aeromonas sobria]